MSHKAQSLSLVRTQVRSPSLRLQSAIVMCNRRVKDALQTIGTTPDRNQGIRAFFPIKRPWRLLSGIRSLERLTPIAFDGDGDR